MIKKHLPVFLGRKVQQQQKETAHTWPGFWGAHVQKRFSNRHGSRCTAAHCCRPSTGASRSFPGVGSRKPHSKREHLLAPEEPGGRPAARPGGSASRANRSPRAPTWLVSSPCSKCTMPWLLHSVSLSTSSSESSRRDEEPVEEIEELDSRRDCRCSELPVLSPPLSGRAGRAWGLPCTSSLSSAVTVSRGMTGGRTPFGGRQPLFGRSGSWRAAAAATAAQRASKREQSSPTVSRLARLSSGLLCSPARGSMAGSAPGACRAALQERRPEACMGERRAAAAGGETSLWLSQSPAAARSPAERRIASPPCPGSSESPAATAGGCYRARWPGARAMGARWARPTARPPPPPRSASALRGGAIESHRAEPRRGNPCPPLPAAATITITALLVSLSLRRPPGSGLGVSRCPSECAALPPRRRSRPPPLARRPRLPGHGGCAARRAPAARGPEGGAAPQPSLGWRRPWTLPGDFGLLRAAHGGPGSVCEHPLGARWHRRPPPGLRGCRGGTATPWGGSARPAGAGMWLGCHQPAGTGWRCVSDRAVPAAKGAAPAALRVPTPRCSIPGGCERDRGLGRRRPPGKPELPVSQRVTAEQCSIRLPSAASCCDTQAPLNEFQRLTPPALVLLAC